MNDEIYFKKLDFSFKKHDFLELDCKVHLKYKDFKHVDKIRVEFYLYGSYEKYNEYDEYVEYVIISDEVYNVKDYYHLNFKKSYNC